MKAVCPNNPNHKYFITTAHVVQTWKVDERGNFVNEISNDEVAKEPDAGNIWRCAKCKAEAKVEA